MLSVVATPVLHEYIGKNNITKAIISKDNKLVGVVELFNISWKNGRGELSIIIKSQLRGRGYGYTAINKMLEMAFIIHGLNRVYLRVIKSNIKAINLYKKVGFIQEGICRSENIRRGAFTNQIQMSILISEWVGKCLK